MKPIRLFRFTYTALAPFEHSTAETRTGLFDSRATFLNRLDTWCAQGWVYSESSANCAVNNAPPEVMVYPSTWGIRGVESAWIGTGSTPHCFVMPEARAIERGENFSMSASSAAEFVATL